MELTPVISDLRAQHIKEGAVDIPVEDIVPLLSTCRAKIALALMLEDYETVANERTQEANLITGIHGNGVILEPLT